MPRRIFLAWIGTMKVSPHITLLPSRGPAYLRCCVLFFLSFFLSLPEIGNYYRQPVCCRQHWILIPSSNSLPRPHPMAPQETLTVPTQRHGASVHNSTSPNRSWQSRVPFPSSRSRREHISRSGPSPGLEKRTWWKTRLFSGMYNDIRRRAPFYWSDWKDAWDYRVVPATVYMYFAKYVPTVNSNNSVHDASCHALRSISTCKTSHTDPCSAYCLHWPFPSTCLRRRSRVLASMRCFYHRYWRLLCFLWLHVSLS
jgi:hypothetical protein